MKLKPWPVHGITVELRTVTAGEHTARFADFTFGIRRSAAAAPENIMLRLTIEQARDLLAQLPAALESAARGSAH